MDEAAQLQLQKTRDREARAATTAHKKQVQEAAKVARQEAKIERDRKRQQRAEELAASRALKKQQQEAATAQKSRDTANTRKRKALHKAAKNPTKRYYSITALSQVNAGPPAASPLPKYGRNQRQIKTPAKFK